jgi:site-specific DNA-methyltransferase (adenine-specific)
MIKHCDVLEGLRELPHRSADIVLVDPPYNIGKDFGTTKDKLDIDEYVNWCSLWLSECDRILKPSGTLYVYGFPEILAHLSVKFPMQHRWLIWHYKNKTTPTFKFWQRSFEAILCGWKDDKERIFNLDDVREPYTETFLKNAAGKTRKGTAGRFGSDKETVYTAHSGGALPRDMIECPALAGGAGLAERWFYCKTCDDAFPNPAKADHESHETIQHPTQKPSCITRKLLTAAKPPKDGLVVIPFIGSGAECVIAKQLGMSYYGFDINEDYIKLATKFLQHAV